MSKRARVKLFIRPWKLVVFLASLCVYSALLVQRVWWNSTPTDNFYLHKSHNHSRLGSKALGWQAHREDVESKQVAAVASVKKNAYSFQLGGCNLDQPQPAYQYFLYGVYIAIYALKKYGSKADFHVWVEMVHNSSHRTLPAEEERVLTKLGAELHYIPTQPLQSYYRTQLQKFRILGLEQYNHVCHLDADILPLTNMDYLFNLIDNGILRKNVVFMAKTAPANGGTFVLTPHPGALQEINQIIYQKEHSKWDSDTGWGHRIVAPDYYLTQRKGKTKQQKWDFWAADGDQGLLYYWVKYIEKDVTIFQDNRRVEHWGRGENGKLKRIKKGRARFHELNLPNYVCFNATSENETKSVDTEAGCDARQRPWKDFYHFQGRLSKPWKLVVPSEYSSDAEPKSPHHYWFSLLNEINQKYGLKLNWTATFGNQTYLRTKGYDLRVKQRRSHSSDPCYLPNPKVDCSHWYTNLID